jgi:hypothetical protein
MNLLKFANVEMLRSGNHRETVLKLFGQSKQTVQNETENYFYNILEEIEFYEFICRVAYEVYHVSYHQNPPNNDKILIDIALQQLEFKVYEFMKTHLEHIIKLKNSESRFEDPSHGQELRRKRRFIRKISTDSLKKG